MLKILDLSFLAQNLSSMSDIYDVVFGQLCNRTSAEDRKCALNVSAETLVHAGFCLDFVNVFRERHTLTVSLFSSMIRLK